MGPCGSATQVIAMPHAQDAHPGVTRNRRNLLNGARPNEVAEPAAGIELGGRGAGTH